MTTREDGEIRERIGLLERQIELNDVPRRVPAIGGPMSVDGPEVRHMRAQVEALEWVLGESDELPEPPRY